MASGDATWLHAGGTITPSSTVRERSRYSLDLMNVFDKKIIDLFRPFPFACSRKLCWYLCW
jgi:hypothetical protein